MLMKDWILCAQNGLMTYKNDYPYGRCTRMNEWRRGSKVFSEIIKIMIFIANNQTGP